VAVGSKTSYVIVGTGEGVIVVIGVGVQMYPWQALRTAASDRMQKVSSLFFLLFIGSPESLQPIVNLEIEMASFQLKNIEKSDRQHNTVDPKRSRQAEQGA
jgi:hypothetical protein